MHSAQYKKTLCLLMRLVLALVRVPVQALGLVVVRGLVLVAAQAVQLVLIWLLLFGAALFQAFFPALRAVVPLAAVRRLRRQAVEFPVVQALAYLALPYRWRRQKTLLMMPAVLAAYQPSWMRLLLILLRHLLRQKMMPLAVYCRRLSA
jgi:hypothetical protein